MNKRIGILGLIGAGKDTLGYFLHQELLARNENYQVMKYASPLKEFTAKVFNCSLDDLESHAFKAHKSFNFQVANIKGLEQQLKSWGVPEIMSYNVINRYEVVFGTGHHFISPREFMQVFGTDVIRSQYPNFWRDILRSKDVASIVPDVRFANELLDYNILIVDPSKPEPEVIHPSEQFAYILTKEATQGIKSKELDLVVMNDGDLDSLQQKAMYIAQTLIAADKLED